MMLGPTAPVKALLSVDGCHIVVEDVTQIISHDVPYMFIVAYHIHSSAFCISLNISETILHQYLEIYLILLNSCIASYFRSMA